MPTRWTESRETYQSHSPIELERELTTQRMALGYLQESHEELAEEVGAVKRKMALHEKAILGILGVLQILMQDKYPQLAALLKGLSP